MTSKNYISFDAFIDSYGTNREIKREIHDYLSQLAYYGRMGYNTDFTEEEKVSIVRLIRSNDILNLELAKQIVLERLNNH